ncbi:MAG: DinB family protein [Ignavibacteriaceae bacterium]|nr:DinB family protein [Ignavibacteriaceae bacterium]
MLKDHFIHLFKYNDWATREAANSLVILNKKDEKLNELFSHIMSAQKIWLNRTLERDTQTNPWEKHTVQECINQSIKVTAEWINLLESLKEMDIERRIDYTNTKSEKFSNTVKDIVVHVINHSTYHRAQITQKIKALGGKPAITDYIVYQRLIQK